MQQIDLEISEESFHLLHVVEKLDSSEEKAEVVLFFHVIWP